MGTIEGFQYYDLGTQVWTSRDDVGSIGRTVWSIDYIPQSANVNQPGDRVVTGRENAWFKGYMEYSDDWGVTDIYSYESQGGAIKDVKFAPSDDTIAFAAGWSDVVDGELLKSTDGGQNWSLLTNYHHHEMTEVAINNTFPDIVYVAGSSQVTKSVDGGATWATSSPDLPSAYGVYAVSISPMDSQILLSSNDLGIYRTTDGGTTWSLVEPTCAQRFAFSRADPQMVAAITFSPYRLLMSQDAGLTWSDWTGSYPMPTMVDVVFDDAGTEIYVAALINDGDATNDGVIIGTLP